MDIRERLTKLQDNNYAIFQAKLMPTISKSSIIGVRIPLIRKLSKEIEKTRDGELFIKTLPHKFYDENILHSLIISDIKDYNKCIKEVDKFLPYIDNWAVCDILKPKVFNNHKSELIDKVLGWINAKHNFICRFGIGILMSFYLDEDFRNEYLYIVARVKSDDYYVNMMIAWFYATALAKQWESTISILGIGILEKWTHNKTIQKAIESFRISDEKKEYLRSLRR